MSRRDYFKEENKLKKLGITFGVTLAITVMVFIYIFNLYNKKLQENARQSVLELGSINAIVPNTNTTRVKTASSTADKGINEVKNEVANEIKKVAHNITENEVKKAEVVENEQNKEVEEAKPEEPAQEATLETTQEALTFIPPVNGEILKDFANETLLYSKTLEEWTVHNGIDIKAPKTTVVLSCAEGVVESIKNDPRYGLTITISHRDGFKTIYSNLLTAEFVSEGQTIEQGRTIGTVGETASFEIADEAHLHFEMMKDGVYVNPTLYLN